MSKLEETSKTKRMRARAIIIYEDKIVSMYREREGRIFYTFPGGGSEGDETEEECVKREVFEEFGIVVKPLKKVYICENQISIGHYFLCEWVSGEFGTGEGEEYQKGQTNGVYKPTMIKIADIPNLPLMPPEVAGVFYDDYMKNGQELRNDVKFILGEIK